MLSTQVGESIGSSRTSSRCLFIEGAVDGWGLYVLGITIIIIIEHLLKRMSLTVHQSSCRLTLIDMIINKHVTFSMLRT